MHRLSCRLSMGRGGRGGRDWEERSLDMEDRLAVQGSAPCQAGQSGKPGPDLAFSANHAYKDGWKGTLCLAWERDRE